MILRCPLHGICHFSKNRSGNCDTYGLVDLRNYELKGRLEIIPPTRPSGGQTILWGGRGRETVFKMDEERLTEDFNLFFDLWRKRTHHSYVKLLQTLYANSGLNIAPQRQSTGVRHHHGCRLLQTQHLQGRRREDLCLCVSSAKSTWKTLGVLARMQYNFSAPRNSRVP